MFAATRALRPQRRAPSGVALTCLLLLWWAACREVADRAATGLLHATAGGAFVPLLAAAFLLFLTILGFLALDILRGSRAPSLRSLLSLPARTTAGREWLIGGAVGWGAVIVAVLPLVLRRSLYVQTWFAPRGLLAAALSIVTVGVSTLTTEAIFRGYGYERLRTSMGPTRATVLLSALYALIVSFSLSSMTALFVSFVFALLLATAWRRTHALWVPWGLHFAWNVALGVLFGLPLFGGAQLSSVIQGQAQGRRVLTGAGLGPIAAPWTVVVLVVGILVLFRLTHDFAWAYTHAPIVAGGYPMDVTPPRAHVAMEQSSPPPPLVQILPNTPQTGSRDGPLSES